MTRPQDFDDLVAFAMTRYGASQETAETIVTNHADDVRAEKGALDAEKEASAPAKDSAKKAKKSDSAT